MSERLTDEQIYRMESSTSFYDWVHGPSVKTLIDDLRHYKKLAEELKSDLDKTIVLIDSVNQPLAEAVTRTLRGDTP